MELIFDKDKFSKRLKTLRLIELDQDLRTTAESIGISTATLHRCENKGMPDLLTALKVCEWLQVSVYDFIAKKKAK